MKIKRWAVLLLTACLMSLPLLGGCEKEYKDLRDDKYITMVFTNTHYEEVESYAPEMKYLLGENDPSTGRMYAAGYIGPMLLTQSIEQMQEARDCNSPRPCRFPRASSSCPPYR